MYELFISGILRSKAREKGKWYIPAGINGISIMVNEPFSINDVLYYLDQHNIYYNPDILYIAYRKLNQQDIERLREMQIPEFSDLYQGIEYISELPKKQEKSKKK
ncbi:MAG: hypothetical protein RXN79_03745 [Candidatus Nanopusillus sp.]